MFLGMQPTFADPPDVRIVKLYAGTPITNLADQSSYSAPVDIGVGYRAKYIVVAALSQAAVSGTPEFTSCTIAALPLVKFTSLPVPVGVSLFGGYVPSVSGGQNIVVSSASGVFTNCTVYAWEVQNIVDGLVDTKTASQLAATTATISETVKVAKGGAVFAAVCDNTVSHTYSWTGVTVNSDPSATDIGSVASNVFSSASNVLVSAAPSGSSTRRLAIISLR